MRIDHDSVSLRIIPCRGGSTIIDINRRLLLVNPTVDFASPHRFAVNLTFEIDELFDQVSLFFVYACVLPSSPSLLKYSTKLSELQSFEALGRDPKPSTRRRAKGRGRRTRSVANPSIPLRERHFGAHMHGLDCNARLYSSGRG